jgi:ribosomal protein S6
MAEMSQTEAEASVSSQANTPKDSRPLYEIGFHVVPTVEEGKVGEVVEALKAEIVKAGGEVVGEEAPAKMTLSYVVERATSGKREKYTEAYFGWVRFVVEERAGIPALENYLQNNKNILRFLFVLALPEEAVTPRRSVFSSNRLEGETLKKPAGAAEVATGEVSDEELNKSIDTLVS